MDNQNFNNQSTNMNNSIPNMGAMPQGNMPNPAMMSPEQYMQWYQQQMQMMQQMQQQMMQQQQQQMVQPEVGQPAQVAPMQQFPTQQQFSQPPVQNFSAQQTYSQPPVNVVNSQMPPQVATGSQPMMIDGQLNQSLMQRDPRVLDFMAQAVREKFKDQQLTEEFISTEAARLYDQFGEELVSHFEPMLSKEQVTQFDGMLQAGETQDHLLEFLMGCIPDLTSKIEQVLLSYKDKYLLTM